MAIRLAFAFLIIGWFALGASLLVDARRDGPESLLRSYLANLGAQRADLALAALTPAAAARWADFVDFQQHNRYEVVSIATRSPSIAEALVTGMPWRATQTTVVLDVFEPSGTAWRGSTVVPVAWREGRWWLERPPLAPD